MGPEADGGTRSALYHRLAWSVALALALLWPARALSTFDGAPLSGTLEALTIGVVVPVLWWIDRVVLRARWMQALIVLILLVRACSWMLVQEGWCGRFSTAVPLSGSIQTIPIDEPEGALRSWDVRAGWRELHPTCTAVVDRPYESADAFPAWFVNILDHLPAAPRTIAMDVIGSMTTREAGTLTIAVGEDMNASARVDGQDMSSAERQNVLRFNLQPGGHTLEFHATLTGSRWRFEPLWNGKSAFTSAFLTVSAPGNGERVVSRILGAASTLLVATLVLGWIAHLLVGIGGDAPLLAWSGLAAVALAAAAPSGRLGRIATIALAAAVAVPVASGNRNARGAFMLLAVPWLAFFAARSFPDIAHITRYSGDDYLTYQLAGARIYMHGFWLEGGSATFDYQPLYRWISGALHLVFGDSSVGETYADAMWMAGGALLAFTIARRFAGFRAGVAAGAGTLVTFAFSTIWYFVGRGLSEIAAAGFAFSAVALLMRARLGGVRAAAAAGLFAVLMFYTRLNQLLFAVALVVWIIPAATPSRLRAIVDAMRRVRVRAAVAYAAILTAGVALFAARTWWYTGVFSVLYGTSLRNNDMGLRASNVIGVELWQRIAHSLSTLVWINEPGGPDVRSALVAAGVVAAVGALCQLPRLRCLPAPLVLTTLGATAAAFVVHTHNYPGRMSIHLVPFAVCTTMCAAATLGRRGARAC